MKMSWKGSMMERVCVSVCFKAIVWKAKTSRREAHHFTQQRQQQQQQHCDAQGDDYNENDDDDDDEIGGLSGTLMRAGALNASDCTVGKLPATNIIFKPA